jgi:Fe-S-cluster-containing hydrogenase component 2
MLEFVVDETKCTRCGQCVRDCVSKIITRNGSEIPRIRSEDEANCIGCQHCLAIYPEAAVSIFGLRPADSQPLKEDSFPALDKMLTLARGRRSVRQYRDENVEQGLQRQLLEALGNAPTGVNRRALTFAVPELKDAAGIPPDSNYYVMLFGVPAVRYPRAVQRDGAARVRRISV